MQILILGTGVIGTTTAWELQKRGHEVTVLDRQPKPAMETSFGNAGLIAPGHSYAWTTPKLPGNLLKSPFQKQQAFRFKPHWNPALFRWGIKFLRQCTAENMKINTARKHQLCSYSQSKFHNLVKETGIECDQNKKGLIYFYRTDDSFREGREKLKLLQPIIDQLQLLTPDELIAVEPAIEPLKNQIAGGIYCPSDESGNCHKFTTELFKLCREGGVNFQFNEMINGFDTRNGKIQKVITNKNEYSADAYVLAMASQSSLFAKQLGDYLPVYPVKGYSITLPIMDFSKAPTHGGIDEDNLLAFSLMGGFIRFTSVAEIAGYDTSHKPADFSHIVELASSLFPDAFDFTNIQYWAGLRPMTPNGSPIFGRGKMSNLYYNTGHGHLGWTMACGSAIISADLIENRKPAISLEGMAVN